MSAKLYLDTEFNGHGGALLSLALVADDDRVFYEELRLSRKIEPWVVENVLPVRSKIPITKRLFREMFLQFIKQYDNPTIVCDWSADAGFFCSLLCGDSYAESLDYACQFEIIAGPTTVKSLIPHNALADACALRDWDISGRPRP